MKNCDLAFSLGVLCTPSITVAASGQPRRWLLAGLVPVIVFLGLSSTASATTISFAGLTDDINGNREMDGTEFLAFGLHLFTVGQSHFNVACGTGTTCVSADSFIQVNDFSGAIEGQFVDASLNQIQATSLSIDFCCSPLTSALTTTYLYGGAGLIATFHGDFNYTGTPFYFFQTFLWFDGMNSLTFEPLSSGVPVPEPSSLLLLSLGALGLIAQRRRRKCESLRSVR
jgi:hypothetical protein